MFFNSVYEWEWRSHPPQNANEEELFVVAVCLFFRVSVASKGRFEKRRFAANSDVAHCSCAKI